MDRTKEVLTEALAEIRALRRRSEIMDAQLGIVEVFAAALGLKRNERGATPDVAWAIEKLLAASQPSNPET